MELAYVVGIRCCTMGMKAFLSRTGTQSGLKHGTNGHDFMETTTPPRSAVRRPLPRPRAPPARPRRGPCSWRGWRSVGGSSQGDIPKWWVNDGYYMVDNIFRIFSKNWGDLRGKHGGSKDLWMGFCRLDLTGIEKWLGLGMGFGRESRRNIKDLRGIWRISEGTLNRISYLMISSDMFMGFLMALKHQKYGFPQQTLGLNCVLPAKKRIQGDLIRKNWEFKGIYGVWPTQLDDLMTFTQAEFWCSGISSSKMGTSWDWSTTNGDLLGLLGFQQQQVVIEW